MPDSEKPLAPLFDEAKPSDRDGVEEVGSSAAEGWRKFIAGIDSKKKSGPAKWFWFLVTMALFVVFMGSENLFSTLTALVPVIIFHELGHLVAMKALGYKDTTIFFIPFLGAAASGRETRASQTKRAFVSIMGPMPGIVAGIVLMAATDWRSSEVLSAVVQLLFLLNLFNLLPIKPLDGGRLFEAVLMSRSTTAAILFSLASPLLLGMLGSLAGDFYLLGFSALLLWGSFFDIKVSLLIGKLKKAGVSADSPSVETLPDHQLIELVENVRQHFPEISKINLARAVTLTVQRLALPKSSVGAALGMISLYVFIAFTGFIGFSVAAFLDVENDPVHGGRRASEWIVRLESSDPKEREQAEEALKQLIHAEDLGVMRGALKTMGELKAHSKTTAKLLVTVLDEELLAFGGKSNETHDGTRLQFVLETLGEFGLLAALAAPELPFVVSRALKHPDSAVRKQAAYTLASFGRASISMLPALASAMEAEEDEFTLNEMREAWFLLQQYKDNSEPPPTPLLPIETGKTGDSSLVLGYWRGREAGIASSPSWTMTITSDEVEWVQGGREIYSGKYRLDDSMVPHTIDFEVERSSVKQLEGLVAKCIYKLENDMLVVAAGQPGTSARPASFKPGNGVRVFEFERQ